MKQEWKRYFRLGVTGLLLFLVIHYWDTFIGILNVVFKAATPLLLGCAMAYIANILMTFYERRLWPPDRLPRLSRLRRPVCLILTFLSVAAILFFVLQMVVPQLIKVIRLLFRQIGVWARNLENTPDIATILPEEVVAWLENTDWNNAMRQALKWLSSGFSGTVGVLLNTVSSVFTSMVNLLLAFVFCIYLLLGKDHIGAQFNRLFQVYLKPKHRERFYYVLRVLNDSFHHFIVGQCSEAVIIGALCCAGMLLLRLPYALAVGALVGVTALIPVAGAYIGAIVGALLIVTTSPVKALIFLVFIVVLQQLEGNLIYPKVVGTSIGLPGIWVLAAITVGGGVMGVLGMFISVPIAAALYQILRRDLHLRSSGEKTSWLE